MLLPLLRILLLVYVVAFPSLPQASQEQRWPTPRYATRGGAATGEVLTEDGDQLRLNVSPCSPESKIVIFRRPYSKEPAGTIQCDGVRKALVQAIQK